MRLGIPLGPRVEMTYLSLNGAIIALQKTPLREEHYEWYRGKEHPYAKEVPKPKWYKVNGDHSEPHCINLKLDNGKDIQFWCPWCGYFERLYGAEILVDNGKIKINE
jgi:hypothetical protein